MEEKDAKLTLILKTDTGYFSTSDHRIDVDQYRKILKILEEQKAKES